MSQEARAIPPTELQSEIHKNGDAEFVHESRGAGRVHSNLPKRVFDIDVSQNDVGGETEAPSQVHDSCQDIRENVTQTQARGLL